MKRIITFIMALSLAGHQHTYTQQVPVIRTVLALGLGGVSAVSGCVAYEASSNTNDSAVGLNLVIAPAAAFVSLSSGIGCALFLRSVARTSSARSLIDFIKKFW